MWLCWNIGTERFYSWWYLEAIERGWVGYEEYCRSKSSPITLSEICRILHILRKPNSIISLSFIQNIFKLFKEKMSSLFFCAPTSSPSFSVNCSIICSGLHFWRQFDVIGLTICSGLHFWCDRFNMTKFFLNLVNSSWLWWIMRVVFANQKRGNILNEY